VDFRTIFETLTHVVTSPVQIQNKRLLQFCIFLTTGCGRSPARR